MKLFADLYAALDETNKTNDKVAAMVDYFRAAPPQDAAWAVYFLSGRKPRQVVGSRKLVDWGVESAAIPGWLFSECYDAVGDMAETITLLLPEVGAGSDLPLHTWIEDRLLPLREADETMQKTVVLAAWRDLTTTQRFVWNKLITGEFRVGVSQLLVIRALATVSGVDTAVIAHRLMGEWTPDAAFYEQLAHPETTTSDISQPYPFCLAHPIASSEVETLGEVGEWQAEWKWDGIRAQVIRREGQTFIWTRGEELVTDRYPEIAEMAAHLPDGTVLDGELLPWKDRQVLPFTQLQRRIGRKTLGKKLLAEVPVIFMSYDLLETAHEDWRERSLNERRQWLETLVQQLNHPALLISTVIRADSWSALEQQRQISRKFDVEGLMLKRLDSIYRVGRVRGDWWKWKVNPYTIDAVLINAQRGSGKRASLYTDYTFGVWDETGQLIPIAKAYSGLNDQEIREVDAFIRRNTLEKFGPVRSVKPELVFELAFEAIQRSTRHKSGIAVRFPRILRWRVDKPASEADTIQTVLQMLGSNEQ